MTRRTGSGSGRLRTAARPPTRRGQPTAARAACTLGLLAVTLFGLAACRRDPHPARLAGYTMGTTYSIVIADGTLGRRELDALHADVEQVLQDINRRMSIYDPDSEISRFNRHLDTEPFAVSAELSRVVERALELAAATGGAFDPTVGELVNLWGFGPAGMPDTAPDPGRIESARQRSGYRHLAVTPDGRLVKAIPDLQLDLGGIAKGYGVDQVARLLRHHGVARFLVEIGGETLAQGLNARGEAWRVGIHRPTRSPAAETALQGIARLDGGRAIATSGDYRQAYRDEHGQMQTHIIDPRTGAPIRQAVASVSVLAPDAMTADSLATALTVLGPKEGQAVLDAHFPGVEALFILRDADGRFQEVPTPGFVAAGHYTPR